MFDEKEVLRWSEALDGCFSEPVASAENREESWLDQLRSSSEESQADAMRARLRLVR